MSTEGMKAARVRKDDEFYTRLEDVEAELKNYKAELKGKRIFLNCDGPQSAFLKYFREHYDDFGLAGLLALGRDPETGGWVLSSRTMSRSVPDGDFRGEFSRDLMKRESDVVITNPPFSLFREYVAQLVEYGKKFLIIGSMNAITYKEIFPLIKENKLWLGVSSPKDFIQPDGTIKKFGNILWYTNLDNKNRHRPLLPDLICNKYKGNEKNYHKYDNYDAIEVSKVSKIPYDYNGVMGVPITFLDKYIPDEFEIVGADEAEGTGFSVGLWNTHLTNKKQCVIAGNKIYKRIFIRRAKSSLKKCK